MQTYPFVIFGQRIILRDSIIPDHTGYGLRLRHPLLLHQQFEGAVAPPPGRHFEHTRLLAVGVDDGPDAQALQQGAQSDALRQLLDRYAGFHTPDVGLAQDQLVEGNVARWAPFDLLNGGCMSDTPRRAAERLSHD